MSASLLGRRSFLRGVGAGALTLPFVRQLRARAEGPAPRRLFILHTPEGFVSSGWAPGQGPGPLASLAGSVVLAPLEPVKEHTVAMSGLEMRSHMMQSPSLQGHYGIAHMLTGIRNKGKYTSPQGPSIDHLVAQRIGARTRFPSLQLGVQCKMPSIIDDKMFNYISYRGADQPNPNEQNPVTAFGRIFSGAVPSEMTPDRLKAHLLRRQSILDLVRGDLTDLGKALGASERPRLDQHLTAIRELETLLDPTSPTALAANCAPPKMDALGGIDVHSDKNFPLVSQAMLDLGRAAFACDLTRVITMQFSSGYGMVVPSWLGLREIHNVVHQSSSQATTEARHKYERWFCEQFAYLVQRMKASPEAGGSMLDSSLAVWMSSQGEGGGHRADLYRVTMAGRAGGAIKTGQYLALDMTNGVRTGNQPHNRLLLSIAHAMGLNDVSVFGEPSLCGKGPLSQLHA